MIGRFLLGAASGALLGAGALAVTSVTLPMPAHLAATPASVPAPAAPKLVPMPAPAASAAAAPDGTAAADGVDRAAPPVVAQSQALAGAVPELDSPPDMTAEGKAEAAAPAPGAAPAGLGQSATDTQPQAPEAPGAAPELPAESLAKAPDLLANPAATEGEAAVGALPQALPLPPAGAASRPSDAAADAAPTALDPSAPPPLTAEEEAMLRAFAAKGRAVALPAQNDEAAAAASAAEAETAAGPAAAAKPAVIAQAPKAPLPRVPALAETGAPLAPDAAPAEASAAAPAPDARLADVAPAEAGPKPPREAFAAAFDNPGAKPLFAIILMDDGNADIDRAAIAALPFPVSIALDPEAKDVAAQAKLYRDAGKELLILPRGLPEGATPQDIEVALEAMAQALGEAVAVMDQPSRSFQADRIRSAQVVPAVADQGRGLVTWNIGLNAADQLAQRQKLAAAVIFRDLDAGGEASPAIRRYLDRAAFKAAQAGQVTVVGRARSETVAALLEWSLEGRAATVALAPVTAVLSAE